MLWFIGTLGYRILGSCFILKGRSSHIVGWTFRVIWIESTTQKRLVMVMVLNFHSKTEWSPSHQVWPSENDRKPCCLLSGEIFQKWWYFHVFSWKWYDSNDKLLVDYLAGMTTSHWEKRSWISESNINF